MGLPSQTDFRSSPLWGVLGYQGDQTNADNVAQNYLETPEQVLARVIKYDPNAHLDPFTYYGAEGVENRQQVVYDQSLLPKQQNPNLMGAAGAPLFNPDAVEIDPNYGPMTVPQNFDAHSGEHGIDWLGILGPLIVGGFAGIGAAGGLSGLFGGASAANPIGYGAVQGANFLTKLPNIASMLGGGQKAAFNNPTGVPGGTTPDQQLMQVLQQQNRGF